MNIQETIDKVQCQVETNVQTQILENAYESIQDQVCYQVWKYLSDLIFGQLNYRVRDQVKVKVRGQVRQDL